MKIFRNVSVILILVTFLLIAIPVCIDKKDTNINSNYTIYELSRKRDANIDAAIKRSNVGIVGEFKKYIEYENVIEFEFLVKEILYGNVPEATIYISIVKGEEEVLNLNEYTYEVGRSYLLILCRHESLFREHARYSVVADIYIAADDLSNATFEGEKIQINGNLKSYIKNCARKNGFTKEYIPLMFKNEDLEIVIKNCDLVLEINVLEIGFYGVLGNQNTYTCEIKEVLKGEECLNEETQVVYINAFKDVLQTGNTYIIALNKIDASEKNYVFNQASKNSIIMKDDVEMISNIKEWLM